LGQHTYDKKELRKAKSVHSPSCISKYATASLSILPANESVSYANYLPPSDQVNQDLNMIYDLRSKYVLGKTGSLPGWSLIS